MQKNFESFYQPYQSDSEDSASITSSDTSDIDQPMTQQPIGSQKFLTQVGGINLNPPEKQIDLRIQPRAKGQLRGVEYSSFDLSGVDKTLPYTGTSFEMTNGTYTSILMINSRDRDTHVYPQPTLFTIRLPRTYRNVVSFQITQMKLLSSFFYFRPDKDNVSLSVLEQGRTITENGQTVDNVIKVTIRTGTYNIDSLLTEIQTQLNRTPLFFYYPNGFSDFITQFTAAGDLSVNFNQPGDTYYNSLNDTFIQNPTITQITQQYFVTRYAGLSIYTLNQVKVAYYYPVIYEMLLDPDFENSLDLELTPTGPQLLPGETIRSRILYTFQGLNDLVIQEIINNNLLVPAPEGTGSILDYYRTLHTFVYSLVNQYNCSYETQNNRIVITTSRLNTSLNTLLNNQAAIALADTLNSCNLTLSQYSNLLTSNTLYTAVFANMYNLIQSNFAQYFAVNFGTYSPIFYTNVSNTPFIQNGIGAVGVATGYSLSVLSSGQEPINSSTQNLQSSPGYWPQIVAPPNTAKVNNDGSNNVIFIGAGMGLRNQDVSATFLNVPYNTIGATFLNTQMIDNSGNIYISPTFGAGDCVTPVYNSKYTVFRFRSFVRQTLQVETLPLPYYYRYPPANKRYFSDTVQYPDIVARFDLSYSYIDSPYLVRNDISDISVTYGQSYTNAFTAAKQIEFTVRNNSKYFSFTAPQPLNRNTLNNITDASGYKYPMRLNFTSVNLLNIPIRFLSPINVFLYHDQGAFFADISQNRNESPYNYKYTVLSSSDLSNTSIDFNAIAGNKYYVIARSQNLSFENIRFKPFVYFPNELSTALVRYVFTSVINVYDSDVRTEYPMVDASYNQMFAQYYDPDYIRLPTSSNLMGLGPDSASFNQFLPITQPAIGYDISGVSTDLTDYRGFQSNVTGNYPNLQFSVDPITRFTFQNLSGYDLNSQTYFFGGSSNAILRPINNTPYTRQTVPYRQTKIVHWYDTNYLPPQDGQRGIPNSNFVATARVFDASYGQLDSYVYDSSGNIGASATGLSLGGGVAAIGFLPSEGSWDVDQFVIKTAYMERPTLTSNFTDPNKNIKYLGIFPNTLVQGYNATDISLNNAIVKLNYSTSVAYTPAIQTINQGFDNVGGTYHLFKKDTSFETTSAYTIVGYTPSVTYNFDSNNYYSIIAFDGSGVVVPFYTPMGSYVPYPKYTKPVNTNTYTDNFGTYVVGTKTEGPGFYYPQQFTSNVSSNYLAQDQNIYQSRYQQSIPIKTSLVTSVAPASIISFSNSLNYYPVISEPLSTLLPTAYTFDGDQVPILLFTKGPFFFWLTKVNLSGVFVPDLTKGNLIITSNLNLAASESNINFRGGKLILQPTSLGSISFTDNTWNPGNTIVPLAFTTNNSGTLDASGIYCLCGPVQNTGTVSVTTAQGTYTSYQRSFIICRFNFDPSGPTTQTPTFTRYFQTGKNSPDFTISCNNTVLPASNNIDYTLNAIPSCNIYTSNYSYTKFYFREQIGTATGTKKVAMIQWCTEEYRGTHYSGYGFDQQTQSYFAIIDCSSSFATGANIDSGVVGFPWQDLSYYGAIYADPAMKYPQACYLLSSYNNNNAYGLSNQYTTNKFFWDYPVQVQPYTIFDWALTETGKLIVSRFGLPPYNDGVSYGFGNTFIGGITTLGSNFAFGDFDPSSGAFYPAIQPFSGQNTDIWFNSQNPRSSPIGTSGYFNQLSVDICGNAYMTEGSINGLEYPFGFGGSNQLPLGLLNTGLWTVTDFGKWIQIGNIDSYYNTEYTGRTTWFTNGCNDPLTFQKSQAVVTPNVFDTEFSPGTAVVTGTLTIPFYKNAANKGIFIQIADLQGYLYTQSKVEISLDASIPSSQSDISGVFSLSFGTNNGFGYLSYYTVPAVPAGGTLNQINNSIYQSFITQFGLDPETAQQYFVTSPFSIAAVNFNTTTKVYSFLVYLSSGLNEIQVNGTVYRTSNPSTLLTLTGTNLGGNRGTYVQYPFVSGNSGYGVDKPPGVMSNTWQVFYPTAKIVLRQLNASTTPITNTTDLIGSNDIPPNTFEHTAMFYYNNYHDLSNDIFNKFGQENKTRFRNYDISSGYGFHSYIFNIPLEAYTGSSSDISSNPGYNFLAIRGYSPCEKFNCLTRFYLPGRYDFGFISLKDLSNETQTVLVDLSGSPLVNPNYQSVLNRFNNAFKGNFTFGSNAVAGFPGSNYSFSGFGNFLNTYIQTYNSGNSNATLLASITSNVNSNVANYIQTYFSEILPSYILTRERFTDPLLFSFLFKSSVPEIRKNLEYEWGLGWNLGYPKIDTPFDTVQRATSFFKILDDYIYLKLNQEFWMNRLDSSGPENLSITHETTGQTNQFAAKLLLANFGSYAQTMIQNPVNFNPVLTAIDRLTFQWVDIAGAQINNLDCEWNAAVQITEQVTQATATSTIPRAQTKK